MSLRSIWNDEQSFSGHQEVMICLTKHLFQSNTEYKFKSVGVLLVPILEQYCEMQLNCCSSTN